MIFQLSDWFPKPMIWAIIAKFDQVKKNLWRISCAEILEVGKKTFAASSVKKMSRFAEVSPEEIKRIAWKFTKTVILLGLHKNIKCCVDGFSKQEVNNRTQMKRLHNFSLRLYFGRTNRPCSGRIKTVTQER